MITTYGSGAYGTSGIGGKSSPTPPTPGSRKRIGCLGDSSDHGGSLVSHNTNGRYLVNGVIVCGNGCDHSCPIPGHGTTAVSAVTTKSYVDGKLVITYGAVAGCGAVITPPDRKVYVE